jgi:hypothetical protein
LVWVGVQVPDWYTTGDEDMLPYGASLNSAALAEYATLGARQRRSVMWHAYELPRGFLLS